MVSVNLIEVKEEFSGIRLEAWFRDQYPNLSITKIYKFIRTGQIRINGKRVKVGERVQTGQTIRVPPLSFKEVEKKRFTSPIAISENKIKVIKDSIIHCDNDFLVLNKPAGLAVQGGSKVNVHVDAMLDHLKFEKSERPRLVHRLDKDTSGALLLARSKKSSKLAMQYFQQRIIRKLYWSIAVGIPKASDGFIEEKLIKTHTPSGERVVLDPLRGKPSRSLYKVLDMSGQSHSFLALEPLTGRTHQLRVHLSEILKTPILGDGKYGGKNAYLKNNSGKIGLCLHCRGLRIPSKISSFVDVYAPIPKSFSEFCNYFGFETLSSFDHFLKHQNDYNRFDTKC